MREFTQYETYIPPEQCEQPHTQSKNVVDEGSQTHDRSRYQFEKQILRGGYEDIQLLENYLVKFHKINLKQYPADIQRRFVTEFRKAIQELALVDLTQKGEYLRKIRVGMSLGIEESHTDEYYIQMLIASNIERITGVIKKVAETINAPATQVGREKYKYSDYTNFRNSLSILDQKSGIPMDQTIFRNDGTTLLDTAGWGEKRFKEVFVDLLMKKVEDKTTSSELMRARTMHGVHGFDRLQDVKIGGNKIDIRALYIDYLSAFERFRTDSYEYRGLLSQFDGAKKRGEEGLGIGNMRGFGYQELGEKYITETINPDKMSFADIMIYFVGILPYCYLLPELNKVPGLAQASNLLKQLSNILPKGINIIKKSALIVGGTQDLAQGAAGINFDGTLHDTKEQFANLFTGTLSILSLLDPTGLGSTVIDATKMPKIQHMVSLLPRVVARLKTHIENINKGTLVIEIPKDWKTLGLTPDVFKKLWSSLN